MEPLTDKERVFVEKHCTLTAARKSRATLSIVAFIGICVAAGLFMLISVSNLVSGQRTWLEFVGEAAFCVLVASFFGLLAGFVRYQCTAVSIIRKLHQGPTAGTA